MSRLRRHWKGITITAVLTVLVLAVGVPFVYIHFIEGTPPKPLSLNSLPSASGSAAGGSGTASGSAGGGSTATVSDVTGTWKVSSGSQVGYRVHEVLAGQSTTAVGRTSQVSGSITLAGAQVTAATFTVQMATVKSDRSQRDQQFAGRIMDTSTYPTGTFTLTKPISLGSSVPAVGATVTAQATGKLTLHGTTNQVSFTVAAKRLSSSIAVNGQIPITYAAYHIDNPSFGGFVSVGNTGTIEFLLLATKA